MMNKYPLQKIKIKIWLKLLKISRNYKISSIRNMITRIAVTIIQTNSKTIIIIYELDKNKISLIILILYKIIIFQNIKKTLYIVAKIIRMKKSLTYFF